MHKSGLVLVCLLFICLGQRSIDSGGTILLRALATLPVRNPPLALFNPSGREARVGKSAWQPRVSCITSSDSVAAMLATVEQLKEERLRYFDEAIEAEMAVEDMQALAILSKEKAHALQVINAIKEAATAVKHDFESAQDDKVSGAEDMQLQAASAQEMERLKAENADLMKKMDALTAENAQEMERLKAENAQLLKQLSAAKEMETAGKSELEVTDDINCAVAQAEERFKEEKAQLMKQLDATAEKANKEIKAVLKENLKLSDQMDMQMATDARSMAKLMGENRQLQKELEAAKAQTKTETEVKAGKDNGDQLPEEKADLAEEMEASPSGIVQLLGYRVHLGNEQWHVRWKGEDETTATWETWRNLDTDQLRQHAEALRSAASSRE